MLYEILKTSKLGASFAPDMYTALWAQKLARDGEVKTLSGAPPLSFQANGTPLLDYLISGNTVQSGTPTPDNPIMPQGTGERTGNLFDRNWLVDGYHLSPQTGLPVDNARRTSILQPIDVALLGRLYLSFTRVDNDNIKAMYSVLTNDDTLARRVTNITSGDFLDVSGGSKLYIAFYDSLSSAATVTKDNVSNVMLNTGSTALPYEPYGYKLDISSGGTTTPIYLGEVQTTRKIKKFVLTGKENIDYSKLGANNRFTISNAFQTADYHIGICSHYKYEFVNANNTVYHTSNNMASAIFIFDNNYTSAADFKVYLAQQYANGTPVTVWYVLATPETTVVNEPLMHIGTYADTLSMEQAGVEIPTARGTNTLDVLTDVKPSEIYIKYKS